MHSMSYPHRGNQLAAATALRLGLQLRCHQGSHRVGTQFLCSVTGRTSLFGSHRARQTHNRVLTVHGRAASVHMLLWPQLFGYAPASRCCTGLQQEGRLTMLVLCTVMRPCRCYWVLKGNSLPGAAAGPA
jgi:hypothetical protein